mmetsp:Transcript_9243/g.1382  ORF Transcript_9243/g.1382 Transcript_9243/m.1382 type:complete len:151 (+) Transcript_9243:642-1094(+)|eukprot:CAMPEP_0168314224 /NCGR_PEP_ID=MMETSP0210-20121227/6781_1 /TAXON_ID=40633 /ORGANISM="Condylostoma magnum, Strain COL2" /LENGTH=150 /DNA_ID=CAMNT_0008279675 /DNA_START=616 /DNA_END=1071 /DNA_ORIENTATION=+
MDPKNICKGCKGKRVLKERKVIEVQVDKGAPNKHKVNYAGESDEAPGLQPGDLIVILTESKHETFERKKADLVMNKKITLKQALTGFSFDITHLDGSKKVIRSNEGDIIKPGDVRTVIELGMPIMRTPWKYGNLFIYYEVEFPLPRSLGA